MAGTKKRGRYYASVDTVYHRCSYRHCEEGATTIVRDTKPHWPTFDHGAGYVCDRHAEMAIRGGCVKA